MVVMETNIIIINVSQEKEVSDGETSNIQTNSKKRTGSEGRQNSQKSGSGSL